MILRIDEPFYIMRKGDIYGSSTIARTPEGCKELFMGVKGVSKPFETYEKDGFKIEKVRLTLQYENPLQNPLRSPIPKTGAKENAR